MKIGFYPGWDFGFVLEYLNELKKDGQRKKAEAKISTDIQLLAETWPRPQLVTVRSMKGHEPLWELKLKFQGIQYRIFFCAKNDEIWLLHSLEKKSEKTPASDLNTAYNRMQNVLTNKVRR